MAANEMLKKVEEANRKEDKITFRVYRNKDVYFEKTIELPDYGTEVMDSEHSFFYFFKDMMNSFEDELAKSHKKMLWDKMSNSEK